MGLNAAVFFNPENLPKHLEPHMYDWEELTGEYLTREPWDHLYEEFRACDLRLTNAGGAGELRRQLGDLGVPEDSVLLAKVLYSGTHCGDFIPLSLVDQLESEVDVLGPQPAGELATFLANMRALIEAAKRQKNPIVFV